ncbi:MAG: YgiQ family radical SAM protein [Bdellovibrionales bacterium RIFOXYD1_FULL_44_7]|nr:MAG: YgiQ family radical SAM protein [Bdellovibrionales bacterium RIFOXYD1_FULL_44_7]
MSQYTKNLRSFVPLTKEEMHARGWEQLDVLFLYGDAYIDHPSFGVPLLARLLMENGYRVGIVAQPRFRNENEALEDIRVFGTPKLFVGIGSGVVDSMLNNYTANKKKRSDDAYSPGGWAGKRPDRAVEVYARLARKAFPITPIVCGGVEASLRRLAHYDYWENRINRSILLTSDVDLLIFGMGERQVLKLAQELSKPEGGIHNLKNERGIAYVINKSEVLEIQNRLVLPSFEEVRDDKKKFARTSLLVESEANPYNSRSIVQPHGSKAVVVNSPCLPCSSAELDSVYNLKFTKLPHYSYTEEIPAYKMIRFSVAAHRGCFGGCSFCAISLHQGKIIQSRSEESILSEVKGLKSIPGFTGIVSDIGGPTANGYKIGCRSRNLLEKCKKASCLFPVVCSNLITDHSPQTLLLRKAASLPGIKKVFIASGVRYDLALHDKEYLKQLITHHVGGHLKVAPEHIHPDVLRLMRKPSFDLFCRFENEFRSISEKCGKEQYLVPYFISSFPGTDEQKMGLLEQWVKRRGWKLQQVQAFIPTPMTLASVMYWSGFDPIEKRYLYVAKSFKERKSQQKMLQPHHTKSRRR